MFDRDRLQDILTDFKVKMGGSASLKLILWDDDSFQISAQRQAQNGRIVKYCLPVNSLDANERMRIY